MKNSFTVALFCLGILFSAGCGQQPDGNDGEIEIDRDSGASRIVFVDDIVA